MGDEEDRRRVLIEVTPIVRELSAKIYGTPEEALATAAQWSDEEADTIHRFQVTSKEWLEERLARIEQLSEEKRSAEA